MVKKKVKIYNLSEITQEEIDLIIYAIRCDEVDVRFKDPEQRAEAKAMIPRQFAGKIDVAALKIKRKLGGHPDVILNDYDSTSDYMNLSEGMRQHMELERVSYPTCSYYSSDFKKRREYYELFLHKKTTFDEIKQEEILSEDKMLAEIHSRRKSKRRLKKELNKFKYQKPRRIRDFNPDVYFPDMEDYTIRSHYPRFKMIEFIKANGIARRNIPVYRDMRSFEFQIICPGCGLSHTAWILLSNIKYYAIINKYAIKYHHSLQESDGSILHCPNCRFEFEIHYKLFALEKLILKFLNHLIHLQSTGIRTCDNLDEWEELFCRHFVETRRHYSSKQIQNMYDYMLANNNNQNEFMYLIELKNQFHLLK